MILIQTVLSLLPVFLFLSTLILLDSFKLVKVRFVAVTLLYGALASLFCYFLNGWLKEILDIDGQAYIRYIAPPVEEFLKAIYIYIILRRDRIGFAVDAAIFGFAVGTGFAFVENIYYLIILQEDNLLIWIIRGFGTAVMHGSTTAIFALVLKSLTDRSTRKFLWHFVPGFIVVMVLHSFFNHFVVSPVVLTIGQLIILPALVIFVFTDSERRLRSWLETGLDTDVRILEYITTGEISKTRIGHYLSVLREKFSGEIIADMLCYLRIYLELAIRAKGYLMMRENGFQTSADADIKAKIAELDYLESSIGQTGRLALAPIFRRDKLSRWQIQMLRE